MKRNVRILALVLLSAMMLGMCCACKKKTPETPAPVPQEISVEWVKGYVASFDNFGDGQTLSQLSFSGSFVEADGYITSDYIKLEKKGTTLTVHSAVNMADEKVFVVSHYKDNGDGTYSLDKKAPNFKACDLVLTTEGKVVYTSSADGEIIRVSLKTNDIPKTEICEAGSPGTTAKFDTNYTLPESGNSIVTDITLFPGSVGSINNTKGYKMTLDYSDSAYRTSQNILIPKKGTTIKYTVSGEYTSEIAAITSWYIAEDGMYKQNSGASNFNAIVAGKDTVQKVNSADSHTFEYTTSFDNEILRLCVPAANTALSVECSVDENYFKGTFDKLHTEMPSKAVYVSDTVWISGYATSPYADADKRGLITPYTVNDTTNVKASDVLEDYVISEPLYIPKKGTIITVMVPNPARDSVSVLSSYEADGVTVNYDKATFIGNPADGNAVFESYNSKNDMSTYKYVTSEDNECIRFTFGKGRTSYVPIIAIKELGSISGTWQTALSNVEDYYTDKLENTKALTSENINPIEVSWNRGYVSANGSIVTGSDGFLYSNLIYLEKAGSVLYFMDPSVIGSDTYTYLGTEGLVFSFWDSEGKRTVGTKGVSSQNVDTYITADGGFRVFRYTSTSDNEYIRLSIRSSQGHANVPDKLCLVFLAENNAPISAGEHEMKFKAAEKDVTCKISLPNGYSPTKHYALLIADNENAYNTAKSAALADTVCVYTNADSGALKEVYAYMTLIFPISGERTYYIGSSDSLSKYVTASLAADKANAEGVKALVKTQSSGNFYADILDDLTMYAMGDSYFQGSGLGTYYTWPSLLAKKYDMKHINYGIGGSTIANVSTNNPMVIRYTSMQSGHADIIILEGGRNDRNKGVPYGALDSRDDKTLCGALNIMIEGLHKKYPNALIILVTPWNYKDSSGGVTYSYAMKMVEYQKYLNLDYVKIINAADTSISGVDMNDYSFREKYSKNTGDISHLNAKGMDLVFPKMELQVAKLYAEFLGITLSDNGESIIK